MYVNPNPFVYELDQKAESAAETILHDILMRCYRPEEMQAQFPVGPYRLDVRTVDGIGWEVDGKEFHDIERDKRRDKQILDAGAVSSIVRIPASLAYHFTDAVTSVVDHFRCEWRGDCGPRFRTVNTMCVSLAEEQATGLEEDFWVNGFDEDLFDSFRMQQCVAFNCYRDVAEIGSPLAFLCGRHVLWSHVPESLVAISKWKSRVERRTNENCGRWLGR